MLCSRNLPCLRKGRSLHAIALAGLFLFFIPPACSSSGTLEANQESDLCAARRHENQGTGCDCPTRNCGIPDQMEQVDDLGGCPGKTDIQVAEVKLDIPMGEHVAQEEFEYVLVQEMGPADLHYEHVWGFPMRIQIHPSGAYAYVLLSGWTFTLEGNPGHGIVALQRNPDTGKLSFLDVTSIPEDAEGHLPDPNTMEMDFGGEYLFVMSKGASRCLLVFRIDSDTGLLTLVQELPCPDSPECKTQTPSSTGYAFIASPDRKHLYRGRNNCIDTYGFTPDSPQVLSFHHSTYVGWVKDSGSKGFEASVQALAMSADGTVLMALVEEFFVNLFRRNTETGALDCRYQLGLPGDHYGDAGSIEFEGETDEGDSLFLVSTSGLPLQEVRVIQDFSWNGHTGYGFEGTCPAAEPGQLMPMTAIMEDYAVNAVLALAVAPPGNAATLITIPFSSSSWDPRIVTAEKDIQSDSWSFASSWDLPASFGEYMHTPVGQDVMQYSSDGRFLYVGALACCNYGMPYTNQPILHVYERVVILD